MPRSKGKKIDPPPPPVGQKRHRKPIVKASSALLPPKLPKIKLTTAPRPLLELSPNTSPSRASPKRERTIELLLSLSTEESLKPEKKIYIVTINW
jgi:hypothetical protein